MSNGLSHIKELTLSGKDYVLVLPGWYPTWQDASPGDFNQRHVIAASLYVPQLVLYITKDLTGNLKQVEERFMQVSQTLAEIIVVYPASSHVVAPLVSNLRFLQLLKKYAAQIIHQFGKPKLLHAYIVLRGGWAAMLLSKQWEIPYCLSEHWTIYYPEDPGYFKKRNPVFKFIVRKVLRHTAMFIPVTQSLLERVIAFAGPLPATVVPNVVDTEKFYYLPGKSDAGTFRFVHISTMYYQKNPEGLLRSFAAFAKQHNNVELLMVGPVPAGIMGFAKSLGLEQIVQFTGSVHYDEVARILRTADALVLFSRYENLPCVILESLCCAVPVISTKVGGIAEVISAQNGILVVNEDEAALLEALENMYVNQGRYNRADIAEKAKALFSYASVGRQLNQIYERLLQDANSFPGSV